MHREPVLIVGAGPLGVHLGLLLARADWPLVGLSSRSHDTALLATLLLGCPAWPDPGEPLQRTGFLLLALPEEDALGVWRRLAPGVRPGTVVAHTGVAGPDLLEGAEHPLALRPLRFARAIEEGPSPLAGAPVALEGGPEAVRRGGRVLEAAGLRPVPVAGLARLRALAATLLGGGPGALDLWGEAGLQEELPAGPTPASCERERAALIRRLAPLDPRAARLLSRSLEEDRP